MPMHYNNEFVFENKSDYLKACEFLKPILAERNGTPHDQDPETPLVASCDDEGLTISFGETCSNSYDGWFLKIPELLAKDFPSVPFRSTAWTSMGDYWWANNRDGKIVPVDHHEEIYEMMWQWGIDINDKNDPFMGPNDKAWAELKHCRDQYVQEMINLGVDITPGTWPPTQEQEDQFQRLKQPETDPDTDEYAPLPF